MKLEVTRVTERHRFDLTLQARDLLTSSSIGESRDRTEAILQEAADKIAIVVEEWPPFGTYKGAESREVPKLQEKLQDP